MSRTHIIYDSWHLIKGPFNRIESDMTNFVAKTLNTFIVKSKYMFLRYSNSDQILFKYKFKINFLNFAEYDIIVK